MTSASSRTWACALLSCASNNTRRMIAYYEGETEYLPANLLSGLAKALGITIERLLGTEPLKKSASAAKPANSRLQRRLAQIENLEPTH